MATASGTSSRPRRSCWSPPPCSTSRRPGCCRRATSRTRRTSRCSRRATCSSRGCCSTARSRRSPGCSRPGWRGSRSGTRARSGWRSGSPSCCPRCSSASASTSSPTLAAKALEPKAEAEVSLHHIHAPRVSVREQAAIVVERLRRSGAMTFRALCGDSPDTLTTVARFLSLLELFREGAVGFDQVTPARRADRPLDRRRRRRRRGPGHRRVRRGAARSRPPSRSRPADADDPGGTSDDRDRADDARQALVDVPLAALRPSLEAVLMVADQPLDAIALATAVGYPVDEVVAALQLLAEEYDEQGRGFELRNVAGGWRYYTREEYAAVVEGVRPRGPAGPADPGGARDARRRRLQAAGLAGPGLGDPRRQRRRRDAHAAHPRPGRGGRARTSRPGRTSTAPPATSSSGSASQSIDELPELAPYLPDLADMEDELESRPRLDAAQHPETPEEGPSTEPDGGTEPT